MEQRFGRWLAASILALALPAAASTNHLVNAHFGSSLGGWTPISPGVYTVTQTGSIGDAALGAASVSGSYGGSGDGSIVLSQCAAVKAGFTYGSTASFQYAAGGYPNRLYAAVRTVWYPGAGCTGSPLDSFDSNYTVFSGMDGVWQHITSTGHGAPAQAVSALAGILVYNSGFGTFQSYIDDVFFGGSGLPGDANLDETVDIADVFYLINYLFAGGPPPFGPVDVDSTDAVDVADVFYLINFLFAGGPAPLS